MRLIIPHPSSFLARPVGKPLLALSDIHGDINALEAILNAVCRIDLSGVVVAGDHCLGGSAPFQVWQRLQEIGAKMTRGASDFALGVLQTGNITPYSPEQEERLKQFAWTRANLGDLVCRRLANLPITEVVSMDDRSGVMIVHGSPKDPLVSIAKRLTSDQIDAATSCIAEDVLVMGMTHEAFVRKQSRLLVVNAGAVGHSQDDKHPNCSMANATLLQGYDDGQVRAYAYDIPVERHLDQGWATIKKKKMVG
jgi:predicted phosphodiesterase